MGHVTKAGTKSREIPGTPAAEDRDLVRRAQAGEVEAYEDLVRRHQKRVFAIVGGILRRREDVEDVAQQVFLKVYLALGRFDLRSAFSTWLYKITVNECWDHLRKKRARKLVYEADLSEDQARQMGDMPGDAGGPTDLGQRAESRQLVERLLAELPEQERVMLVLKEAEGFSVEEIGRLLDMNVNTVKVRLFRARGKLMEIHRRRARARSAGRGKKE